MSINTLGQIFRKSTPTVRGFELFEYSADEEEEEEEEEGLCSDASSIYVLSIIRDSCLLFFYFYCFFFCSNKNYTCKDWRYVFLYYCELFFAKIIVINILDIWKILVLLFVYFFLLDVIDASVYVA